MLALLKKMVLINSYTYNKKGVDLVGDTVKDQMERLDFTVEIHENDNLGNNLVFYKNNNTGFKPIMLCGHTDTVFPETLGFNSCREDKDFIYGPGVIDMKGGLVVGIFALRILKKLGVLNDIPIIFVFNSDEEIGSPSSKQIIMDVAKKSSFAYVLECGGLNGDIVTGRKGKISANIEVEGKASHAAFIKGSKPSAILEMADKIISLESLNNFEDGVTVNVGTVKGGVGPNTVPEYAAASVDIRFATEKEENDTIEKIENICNHSNTQGTKTKYKFFSFRPPMEQNKKNRQLFDLIKKESDKLHIKVTEEYRYGVSDANFISKMKTAVVDGMGPIGDDDHSKREYMMKSSFRERTALLASSILSSWRYLSAPGNTKQI